MATRTVLALLALLAKPAVSEACTWMAPNDIFTMAEQASHVSIVSAVGPSEGRVERDLKGSGAASVRVGRSNCGPSFDSRGARYLLFHRGDGTAISDSSSVLLIGDVGERIVRAVERFLLIGRPRRSGFVEVTVINELSSPPDTNAFRFVYDGVKYLGSVPEAVGAEYTAFLKEERERQAVSRRETRQGTDNLFRRLARAHMVAVIRSGEVVEELTRTGVRALTISPALPLTPGAEYLVHVDAKGVVHSPTLLLGEQRTTLVGALRPFLSARTRAQRRVAVEEFLREQPSPRWRPELVDAWAWLVANRQPLAKATCAARKTRGAPPVRNKVRAKWARIERRRLCRPLDVPAPTGDR